MFKDVPVVMLNALYGAILAWEKMYANQFVSTPALAQIQMAKDAINEEMNRRYAEAK